MKKKLPFRTKEFPDEEWVFIFPAETGSSNGGERTDAFLFYEMARDLERGGAIRDDLSQFLGEATDGHFPAFPFLLLPESARRSLLDKIAEPGSLYQLNEALLSQTRPIEWTVEHPLLDEFSREVDDAAWDAAAERAQQSGELEPEDFMPATNPGALAAQAAKRTIIKEESEPLDTSRCQISMLIDLEYPPAKLVEEFKGILAKLSIYKDKEAYLNDRRGRGRSIEDQITDFAAYRLKARLGSMPAAREKAETESRRVVVESDNAWREKILRGRRAMEAFRNRWGLPTSSE